MRQYPIWFNVTNCNKKSSSSYGGKDTAITEIAVGSSSTNSHSFLSFKTTRRFEMYKEEKACVFRFSVDNIVLKIMIFKDNDGKAGDFIKTITKLKKIKSLRI